MSFFLGIICGILLSMIAFFSGRKIRQEVDAYEKKQYAEEHPRQMAKIVKMESAITKLLKEE